MTEILNYEHNSAPRGAGGIVSTVHDLLVWNRNLHKSRVLNPEVTTLMLTEHVIKDPKNPHSFYCYGIGKTIQNGEFVFEHNGGIPGFHTMLSYNSSNQLSFGSFQNIELEKACLDKLYAAEDEAYEQFKDLKESDRKRFDDAVNAAITNKVPAELETMKRIRPIRLGDILN